MNQAKWMIQFVVSLLFLVPELSDGSHVHFIHQSTGGSWLNDYDEWDPDWGGGNLRADLESDGRVVTDNWHDDDNAPYCEWDPEWQGLCALFINDGARLPAEAKTADIIIIKSCFYPTQYLTSDEVLQGWIDHSISDIVEGYMNNHPEQNLIYCSSVPHHRQGEECPPAEVRARGRSWGEWLENESTGLVTYATNDNVIGFSAYALTARPPGVPNENTLKAEYEISYPDNHMNRAGNLTCAAELRALVNSFGPSGTDDMPRVSHPSIIALHPNPCSVGVEIRSSLLSHPEVVVTVYSINGQYVWNVTRMMDLALLPVHI